MMSELLLTFWALLIMFIFNEQQEVATETLTGQNLNLNIVLTLGYRKGLHRLIANSTLTHTRLIIFRFDWIKANKPKEVSKELLGFVLYHYTTIYLNLFDI